MSQVPYTNISWHMTLTLYIENRQVAPKGHDKILTSTEKISLTVPMCPHNQISDILFNFSMCILCDVGGRHLRIAPKGQMMKGNGDALGPREQIMGLQSEPKSHRNKDLPKDHRAKPTLQPSRRRCQEVLGPKARSVGD
jgi:hypothetical protein